MTAARDPRVDVVGYSCRMGDDEAGRRGLPTGDTSHIPEITALLRIAGAIATTVGSVSALQRRSPGRGRTAHEGGHHPVT
jgi:hypothetical protein